jgi:hypothetical protein
VTLPGTQSGFDSTTESGTQSSFVLGEGSCSLDQPTVHFDESTAEMGTGQSGFDSTTESGTQSGFDWITEPGTQSGFVLGEESCSLDQPTAHFGESTAGSSLVGQFRSTAQWLVGAVTGSLPA